MYMYMRLDLFHITYINAFWFSELESKPVGTLEVRLIQAKKLTNKDLIGKSDPFAVVFVRPLRDQMKTSKTIVRQLLIFLSEFLFVLCAFG